MAMKRWLLSMLVCAVGLLGWPDIGRGLNGDTYAPHTKIQIELVDNALVAVGSSVSLEPFALAVDEQVLSIRSRGSVAAVLTSNRFLAISESSSGWVETPFSLNEGYAGKMTLSDNMVMMNTQDRVVGFDGVYNRLIPYDLPAGERVFDQGAGLNVLVFTTEYRAAGLAAGSDWNIQDFAISETFRGLTVDADRAAVQTSTRLLTFSAAEASWSTP